MKWPNDILNRKGEKMGGVLVESSNDEASGIRIGIGVNRYGFSKGEKIRGCGWEETLGDLDAMEVFKKIDRGISSIFEKTGIFPLPSKDSLVIQSWTSLSKSLSRGVAVRLDNEVVRPSGLNEFGELRVTGGSIGVDKMGDFALIVG